MSKMEVSNYSTDTGLANLSVLMVATNASNVTDEVYQSDPLVKILVPIVMFASGVFGNLVALLVLWRSRKENARSVFYRLVAGLAATDLFGTMAVSPVTILVYSRDLQWVGGEELCDYFSFMMIFAGLATVLIVGAMAIERYLAILHPYKYELHVSPHKVKHVVLAIWIIATLISCLPLVGLGRNVRHYPGTWCFFDYYSDRSGDKVFSFFYASVGLGVIAGTAVSNTAVMCVLLRMRRVSKNMGKSTEGRTLNMTSEMQMIFFLAGIILVFAACYAPLMVRVIINATRAFPKNQEADLLVIRLASANQILDPWVYLLLRRRLAALLYSACKTVSPLQNMSSLKTLRGSEYLNDGKETPSPKFRNSANGWNGHLSAPESPREREGTVAKGREVTSASSWPVVCQHGQHRVLNVENGTAGGGQAEDAQKRELLPLLQKSPTPSVDSQCSQCGRQDRDAAIV